jgi:hypothetical protein
MKRIIRVIESKQEALEKGKLFRWLSDESVGGHERLSFAPSMLFYLMAFKDVLGQLYRPDPYDELQRYVNAYCHEDAEHWRWYLEDLETLGYGLLSWGSSIPAFCNSVWSPETESNRKTIFSLIEYARRCDAPLFSLVLIQIFEATGAVFLGHTRMAAAALGLDDELNYFGRRHYEEELEHSVKSSHLAESVLNDSIYSLAGEAVEVIFGAFEEMFDCWFAHRNKYERVDGLPA